VDRAKVGFIGYVLLLAACVGLVFYARMVARDRYVVTVRDYRAPEQEDGLLLRDDDPADKRPAFDPELVDSRVLGYYEDWEVNKSAAVIELDCPLVKPGQDNDLLRLRSSYADVVAEDVINLLPSANMLDAVAKQFDDGLYAAVDLACFRGELGLSSSVPDLLEEVFGGLDANSPARPFLAAALSLASRDVPLTDDEEGMKARWLARFEMNGAASTPISFYTWDAELERVWRTMRFLQHEFVQESTGGLAIPRDIARVLELKPELLSGYRAVNTMYGRLTNPLVALPVDALIGAREPLPQIARRRGVRHASVAVFPPSTSRENELFGRLFPGAVPPEANLMVQLIRRVRSGEVDLAPTPEDGWYQWQVYALETLLLPKKGQEGSKLLLTVSYKKRLIEAFKAMVTKRREVHARQTLMNVSDTIGFAEGEVQPRLRIEPCATFYLRTARAYGFVRDLLAATAGEECLAAMHGLKEDGLRDLDLASELDAIMQRFYGFYLVACEDIGMRPEFLPDEPVDADAAKADALAWLEQLDESEDLARDVRISVPVYSDQATTCLWAVLGVRLAKLDASYARAPKIRPADGSEDWSDPEGWQLGTAHYVIPVEEFGEFRLTGTSSLTREQFRAICDRHRTKDRILKALSGM
jgi:hypothetical protein